MRIVGGVARGRRLRAPKGSATRPTADRVREAIFNILGPPPAEARILDLFAGSGTLGLEALSRGAAAAVFVDSAPAAVKVLRANLDSLGMADEAAVFQTDVLRALRRLDSDGQQFEWVFVDPPYASELATATLAVLASTSLLASGARVIVEHDRRHPPATPTAGLSTFDQRSYGDTALSLYERAKSP